MSSTYKNKGLKYGFDAAKCIDGKSEGDSSWDLCVTDREPYPFLVLEYEHPVEVSWVIIYSRRDILGVPQDTSEMSVIVTDEYPTKGKKAKGIITVINFYVP